MHRLASACIGSRRPARPAPRLPLALHTGRKYGTGTVRWRVSLS